MLVALLFLSSAPAYADGVSFDGSARLRLRSERNLPDTVVRYDAAANAFALSGYLNSEEAESESFSSLLASLGLEGRHLDGDLRWVVTADTGELRRHAGSWASPRTSPRPASSSAAACRRASPTARCTLPA